MNINERICQIRRDFYNDSNIEFANALGVSAQYASNITKAGKNVGDKVLSRIIDLQPTVNSVWLKMGEGSMLKSDTNTQTQHSEELLFPAKPFIDSNYAACGKPGGFSVCVKAEDCEKLSIPFFKDYDFSIVASGDSMINRRDVDRSIKSGDIVACRVVQSRTHVRYGEVYALSTLDGFTIKQVVPSEKENCIKCISFNTEDNFYPFDLPVEEIYDWAFVVGVARINRW